MLIAEKFSNGIIAKGYWRLVSEWSGEKKKYAYYYGNRSRINLRKSLRYLWILEENEFNPSIK